MMLDGAENCGSLSFLAGILHYFLEGEKVQEEKEREVLSHFY